MFTHFSLAKHNHLLYLNKTKNGFKPFSFIQSYFLLFALSNYDINDVIYVCIKPLFVYVFHLKGPVAVKVQVPNMQDKTEWKLNGQILNFTVPLTDQVQMCRFSVLFYVFFPRPIHKYCN